MQLHLPKRSWLLLGGPNYHGHMQLHRSICAWLPGWDPDRSTSFNVFLAARWCPTLLLKDATATFKIIVGAACAVPTAVDICNCIVQDAPGYVLKFHIAVEKCNCIFQHAPGIFLKPKMLWKNEPASVKMLMAASWCLRMLLQDVSMCAWQLVGPQLALERCNCIAQNVANYVLESQVALEKCNCIVQNAPGCLFVAQNCP